MPAHLQKELEKLKRRILGLGAQVEERVRLAAHAVDSLDLSEAENLIKSDYLIDETEVEIEEECLKILALHQPVAVDLRLIVATIKINNDLERISDETVNIAFRIKEIITHQNGCAIRYDYTKMISQVRIMLKKSLDSLINLDVDAAFKVLLIDDEVDKFCGQTYRRSMVNLNENPGFESYFVNYYLISRHLERIADHATNIAEEVIYMVEGEIVRHGQF